MSSLFFLDLETKQSVLATGHQRSVYAIAALSSYVFTGSYDKTIKVWDVDSYVCKQTLQGHSWGIFCLAIFVKNEHVFLFSGSGDHNIMVLFQQSSVIT